MRVAMVKTADGWMLYSIAREAHKMAAVRSVIDQFENHSEEVFDTDPAEATVAVSKIKGASKPYQYCLAEGYIHEVQVLES